MSREQFDKQTQLPTEFCEATVDYRRDHDIPSNLSLTATETRRHANSL